MQILAEHVWLPPHVTTQTEHSYESQSQTISMIIQFFHFSILWVMIKSLAIWYQLTSESILSQDLILSENIIIELERLHWELFAQY